MLFSRIKFNDHFVEKISNIRQELSSVNVINVDVNKLSYGMGGPTCAQSTLSEFRPVSAEELRKIILSRKIKTSISDTIPAPLLRNSLDDILPALVQLVNISLSTGSIEGLKDSIVNPLLKKCGLVWTGIFRYRTGPDWNIPELSQYHRNTYS